MNIQSAELEQVIRWVDEDHAGLQDLVLEPDGRFQTRRASSAQLACEVADSVHRAFVSRPPESFPRLVYGVGRARGGSTSLANVFGIAGLASYYQPVKAALRRALIGHDLPAAWVPTSAECVFAKETFGPYSLAECIFLPIDILLQAGYPRDRIEVVLFDREPASALGSWLQRWGHRLPEDSLLAHFVVASLSVRHCLDDLGIQPELAQRLFVC